MTIEMINIIGFLIVMGLLVGFGLLLISDILSNELYRINSKKEVQSLVKAKYYPKDILKGDK